MGWRDVPVEGLRRHHRQLLSRPTSSSSSLPPRRRSASRLQDAFERKLYVDPPRAELAAGPDLVVPSLLEAARSSTRACSPPPQLLGYYPTCKDTRPRPRWARALALLDQHLPELGARAPYRYIAHNGGDQHAARQRQLDARARSPARVELFARRTSRSCCRACARAGRTRDVRHVLERSCWRAARCRTRYDDDPGGLRRGARTCPST